jgi:Zn-dependent protease with chaperone function
VQELSAVIVHELGHFKGADTAFSLHFYSIYRGTFDSLQGVSEPGNGGLCMHTIIRDGNRVHL